MHLKNYSLYAPNGHYVLSPAYDLLSTALVMPKDKEELALTLAGKKRKLSRQHFVDAMISSGLGEKVAENIVKKFIKLQSKWQATIAISFISEEMKESYQQLINHRLATLSAE